jgi:hypothetical protein
MKTREQMLELISSLAPSIHYLAIKEVHELAPGVFAVKDNEFTWELVFDSTEYRCGNDAFEDIASGIDAPEGLGITEDPSLTWNSKQSVRRGGETCLVRNDDAPIAWHDEPISIDF